MVHVSQELLRTSLASDAVFGSRRTYRRMRLAHPMYTHVAIELAMAENLV